MISSVKQLHIFYESFYFCESDKQQKPMAKKEDKPGFLDKLRYKYRLSVYRDETYEEVLNFRLSRLNVFTIGGTLSILLIILVVMIVAYTPVRNFIPGYPDEHTIQNIYENSRRVDSLIEELDKRDRYFDNIKAIISGKQPNNYDNVQDTSKRYTEITFERSSEDSAIRQKFEENSEFDLSLMEPKGSIRSISQMHFFPPVKGLITNKFNSGQDHYGLDIVSAANEVVKTTLDGTVTMATWTLDTGWIIEVQHLNNLISIYKHNSELLKRVGDYVKAGEPVAIIGNSGELTSGPHLHFELWYNGAPLNPEDYISF